MNTTLTQEQIRELQTWNKIQKCINSFDKSIVPLIKSIFCAPILLYAI